jgi:hypothetical protein
MRTRPAVRGLGIDLLGIDVGGYVGETIYDSIVYDDFRIAGRTKNNVGFLARPKSGHVLGVCQTIDIRSLFVEGPADGSAATAPAVLLQKCNEVLITCSKAWGGGGDTVDTWGVAPWFFEDCRAVNGISLSAACATVGFKIYSNTFGCAQISLINPTFESISGNPVIVDSSDPTTIKTDGFYMTSPRYQGTVTGTIGINGLSRGRIEAGRLNVSTYHVGYQTGGQDRERVCPERAGKNRRARLAGDIDNTQEALGKMVPGIESPDATIFSLTRIFRPKPSSPRRCARRRIGVIAGKCRGSFRVYSAKPLDRPPHATSPHLSSGHWIREASGFSQGRSGLIGRKYPINAPGLPKADGINAYPA